ncbi:MAG: GNAT family N-acetyltransferase, partial [Verrucomicrobia bacterium]|nr:GNAT family N-acetyltransferase [Verrucomicrobiota bacterium]
MIIEEAHNGDGPGNVIRMMQECAEVRSHDAVDHFIPSKAGMLPGLYVPPSGGLLLAREGQTPVGCLAFCRRDADCAEIKRPHQDPMQTHADLGRRLYHATLRTARRRGFKRMRLELIPGVEAARHHYIALGFTPTTPYGENPNPNAQYVELDLAAWCQDRNMYGQYLALVNRALGITDAQIAAQSLPRVQESTDLFGAGNDMFDRPQAIAAQALPHWSNLLAGGRRDG